MSSQKNHVAAHCTLCNILVGQENLAPGSTGESVSLVGEFEPILAASNKWCMVTIATYCF